jgi:hypothetical protein
VFIAMAIDDGDPLLADYLAAVTRVCQSLHLCAARVDRVANATRIVDRVVTLIESARILKGWQNWDMLGMLEQLRGERKSATYIATA